MAAVQPDRTAGIGGSEVKATVLDAGRKEIPLHLTFNSGEKNIHIDHETLAKLSGVQIANQINPTAFSFGAASSDASHTTFLTASLGPPGDKQPLHTLDRTAHISSSESTTPGHSVVTTSHHVVSPNSVWDRGTPTVLTLQNLTGAYGTDHPSAGHLDSVSDAIHDIQAKQATNWKESIGASEADIMHGCITAEKSGVTRTSIPISDDARIAIAKGQLSALVMKHSDNLGELFGEHHITGEHYNQALGKSVRHVVVPADVAVQAMRGLKANLQKAPLSSGMTISCTSAHGTPPDGDVHVAMTLHRAVPEAAVGKAMMLGGNLPGGGGGAAPPADVSGSALASAMFGTGVKFSKKANNGKATPAAAPPSVTVHTAAGDSTGAGGSGGAAEDV